MSKLLRSLSASLACLLCLFVCAVPSMAVSVDPSFRSATLTLPSGRDYDSAYGYLLSATILPTGTFGDYFGTATSRGALISSSSVSDTAPWLTVAAGDDRLSPSLSFGGFANDPVFNGSRSASVLLSFASPVPYSENTLISFRADSFASSISVKITTSGGSSMGGYQHTETPSAFYFAALLELTKPGSPTDYILVDSRRFDAVADSDSISSISCDFEASSYLTNYISTNYPGYSVSYTGVACFPVFDPFSSGVITGYLSSPLSVLFNYSVSGLKYDTGGGSSYPPVIDDIKEDTGGILSIFTDLWGIITSPFEWLSSLLIPTRQQFTELTNSVMTKWSGSSNLFISVFNSLLGFMPALLSALSPSSSTASLTPGTGDFVFPGISWDFGDGSGPLQILPSVNVTELVADMAPFLNIIRPILAVCLAMAALYGVYNFVLRLMKLWISTFHVDDMSLPDLLHMWVEYLLHPVRSFLTGR